MVSLVRLITKNILKGLSTVLLTAGAIVFWVGDRFLREILHARFLTAEVAGIGAGIILMCLGGMVGAAAKGRS